MTGVVLLLSRSCRVRVLCTRPRGKLTIREYYLRRGRRNSLADRHTSHADRASDVPKHITVMVAGRRQALEVTSLRALRTRPWKGRAGKGCDLSPAHPAQFRRPARICPGLPVPAATLAAAVPLAASLAAAIPLAVAATLTAAVPLAVVVGLGSGASGSNPTFGALV